MKGTQKLSAVLTLLILAFGFLPLLAQPLPYKGLDWLSLGPSLYYGDAHEPDDSRHLAKECTVNGATQIHNFHAQGEQDWIWFRAETGRSYAIEAQARPLGSLADTVLELYNANGVLLAHDDDGGDMTDALLQFEASYTGVYYGQVTEWADRYGDVYWYHLRVKQVKPYQHYLPIVIRRAL